MGDVWAGMADFWAAHRLIWRHKLWRWLMIPGLLSVLYWPAALAVLYVGFRRGAEVWFGQVPPGWLATAGGVVLGLVLAGIAVAGLYVLHRTVILVVCAPLWGPLSESAERALLGTPGMPFSVRQLARDVRRAGCVGGILLALSLLCLIGCWLLALVPIVGLAAIVLLPATQAFFAGAGYIDPTLERHKVGVRGSLRYLARHRWRVLGNGLGYSLLMLVPLLGWFLAPGYAVVAATIGVTKCDPLASLAPHRDS